MITVLIPATTAAATSDIVVYVGPNDAITFQQNGLGGVEVVDIQIKIEEGVWTTIPAAALTINNVSQRMVGPAFYRVDKGVTASCVVSVTTSK